MEFVYNDIFGTPSPDLNLTLADYLSPEDITIYRNLPLAIVYFLLSVLGLLGNSLVMYIFLRYAKMRTVSNIYIYNLAIGDTLLMLVLLFRGTQQTMMQWPFGIFWCKLVLAVESMNPILCITFVTLMSIDRCVVFYRPLLASKWRKPKVASLLSIAVWVISFLSSLPVIVFGTVPEYHSICEIIWPSQNGNNLYTYFQYSLGFVQPVLLIVVCLLMTAVKAQPPISPLNASKHKGSDRTRMVVMLFVVHLIFWLPSHIFTLLYNLFFIDLEFITGYQVLMHIGSVVTAMSYVKSCIYPILYWYLSCDFRQCFPNVMCCNKREQRQ